MLVQVRFSVTQRLLLVSALHKPVVTHVGTSAFFVVFQREDDDNKINKKQVYLKMQ